MGILRRLAEAVEGNRLYSIKEIEIPEKASIIIILGASQIELRNVQEYWNANDTVPVGTLLTGRRVTIQELKDLKK